MNKIPSVVIRDLIDLGALGDEESPGKEQLLERLNPFDWVNRCDWQSEADVLEELSEADLKNLVRGLTSAERHLRWCGGSVAAVIWVYLRYAERFPATADDLADWVLFRSDNPYVPFGRSNGGARSLQELRDHRRREAQRYDMLAQTERDQRQKALQRRSAKAQSLQTQILRQQTERQERKAFMEQLEALPWKERFQRLAEDEIHVVDFYPENYAGVSVEILKEIPPDVRLRLIQKLKYRIKGRWARFCRKLEQASID